MSGFSNNPRSENAFPKYIVRNHYESGYDTLEQAEAVARSDTWNRGAPHGVWQLVAMTETPEIVNTVKLNPVS